MGNCEFIYWDLFSYFKKYLIIFNLKIILKKLIKKLNQSWQVQGIKEDQVQALG
jgi:hypothetical protein